MHVASPPFAPPDGVWGNEYRTMVGWYAKDAVAALEALSKLPRSPIRCVDHSASPYR
ncbi:MAG: hypothetical protein ACXVEE_04780 [Polyangiales bacterium]